MSEVQSNGSSLIAGAGRSSNARVDYGEFVAGLASKPSVEQMAGRLGLVGTQGEFEMRLNLLHGVVGVATEAAELLDSLGIPNGIGDLLDAIKKFVFNGRALTEAVQADPKTEEIIEAMRRFLFGDPNMVDKVNLVEELGDLEFYLELARQSIGVTRNRTIEVNTAKLNQRYAGGYSDAKSLNRNTESERKTLEKGVAAG